MSVCQRPGCGPRWWPGESPTPGAAAGQPTIIGTRDEVADVVARYQEAGADELIVPDHTLGRTARKQDTCDPFMHEVALAFR
jgi:alkanesulfonate monooxygenase SsuD/methylene tetrahydromethanopterin reductase-like flavin-dependent oxidoreductase (luciferase family)